jgi:hypothetical protein
MGYEASYEGRIDLDPPMDAEVWERLLDAHPNYGAIRPQAFKVLDPMILPVLSEDHRHIAAVEPGKYGHKPSAMHGALRHFVWCASLFASEEGRFQRFSGGFDAIGEDGDRFRLTVGDTDPIATEEISEPE